MYRVKTVVKYPIGFICLLLTGLILSLIVKNDYLFVVLNVIALNGIAVTGLNLLYDATGQVSLGHAAFFGLGAYTTAIFSVTLGLPLWVSWLAAVVLVVLVSFALAFPTLRLHGHYMVMATLGCNIILTVILNQWESVTGGPSGFPGIPRLSAGPLAFVTDRDFFRLACTAVTGLAFVAVVLQKSAIGRIFKAVRQNEVATESSGINTTAYKVAAFVLSALYAGLAGILYAHYMSFISPKTFGVFRSLEWVTMAVVGGMGNVAGGLIGAAVLTFLPELLHTLEEWQVLFYGLVLMGVLIVCPQGLVPAIRDLTGRIYPAHKKPVCAGTFRPEPLCYEAAFVRPDRQYRELRLENLSVDFGGVRALSSVSVVFDPGRIHAVIGPNGAGKTTLFNAICGIVRPQSGRIFLGDRDITGLPSYGVALCGIGRTFQVPQLYPEFSVREHVLVGIRNGRFADAEEILRFFDLVEIANRRIGEVSLFDRKRLELARALAANPSYILVDEPGGGLNEAEKEIIGRYLLALRRKGLTPIVIDHHMDLVMNVADRVVVMHQGRIIADGSPQEVIDDPRVVDAYLGSRHRMLSELWPEKGMEKCRHA